MTEEEAIKRIRLLQQEECDCIECRKNKEAYEIVLNLIEKQGKKINELEKALIDDDYKHRQEIEKKDKIIHSMAKHIRNPKVIFEGGRGHQHIIEYFEKKEEE